jgi:hypothetical protein
MGISHQQDHWWEENPTDRALVAAAAGGDPAAWDALVDRYVQSVWTTAIGRGLDPSRAAQVSAVTWLRCADHLDELTDAGNVGDWLLATASRQCDLERVGPADKGHLSVAPWPGAMAGA